MGRRALVQRSAAICWPAARLYWREAPGLTYPAWLPGCICRWGRTWQTTRAGCRHLANTATRTSHKDYLLLLWRKELWAYCSFFSLNKTKLEVSFLLTKWKGKVYFHFSHHLFQNEIQWCEEVFREKSLHSFVPCCTCCTWASAWILWWVLNNACINVLLKNRKIVFIWYLPYYNVIFSQKNAKLSCCNMICNCDGAIFTSDQWGRKKITF